MGKIKLVVVVVTYNRLEKLKKALSSYEVQTKNCSDIVVVNNCSTDGTDSFLQSWENTPSTYLKHVLKTGSNVGGAGGFYIGMEYALKINADWVWLADDDAYPEKDAFANLLNYITNNSQTEKISAICSKVMKPDGTIDTEHRGILSGWLYWNRKNSNYNDYQKDYFKIDLLSYVGVALSARALNQVGLCNKDFFIHFDDSEHSIRLRECGDILCVPSISVLHDTPTGSVSNAGRDYGWKTYYCIRNTIYSYLRHHVPTAIVWILRIILWQNFLYMIGSINTESRSLMMDAVIDGCKGKLGIHNVFKPGYNNSHSK